MKFTRTKIEDVVLCEPSIIGDERGYFFESFREDELTQFLGQKIDFCQDNESKSSYGVLRGLHYQLAPYAQTKLIRVIEGVVLDIAVDIRKGSPTFGMYVSMKLSGKNKKQLLVPKGFAHGFVVLSELAVLAYKVDNYYHKESDRGIAFDDVELKIDWQLPRTKLKFSGKDANQPSLMNAECFNKGCSL